MNNNDSIPSFPLQVIFPLGITREELGRDEVDQTEENGCKRVKETVVETGKGNSNRSFGRRSCFKRIKE